jgi:putative SOS response-associated peptidase YedK
MQLTRRYRDYVRRISATFEFSDIRVRWNLDRDLPSFIPRFNISPQQISPTIPVIVRDKGGNECRLMRWGTDPVLGQRRKHRQPND